MQDSTWTLESVLPNVASYSAESQRFFESLLDEFRRDVLGVEPGVTPKPVHTRPISPSIESVLDSMSEEDLRFWRRIDSYARAVTREEASFRYKGEPAVPAEVPVDWTPDFVDLLETEHGTTFAVVCVFKGVGFPHGNSYLLLFHREEDVFCVLDGGELCKTTASDLVELSKWIEENGK